MIMHTYVMKNHHCSSKAKSAAISGSMLPEYTLVSDRLDFKKLTGRWFSLECWGELNEL